MRAWTLLVAAAVLAGCTQPLDHPPMGGDGHGDHDHGHMGGESGYGNGTLDLTGEEDVTFDVVAGSPEEFRFVPDRLNVTVGDRVGIRFTNEGQAPHEFDLAQFGFHLHAEPGRTVEGAFIADAEGTFEAACFVPGHYQAGMRGTIAVNPPA